MAENKAYSGSRNSGCVLSSLPVKTACLALFLSLLLPFMSRAQQLPDYDEISVFIEMQEVGGSEINSLIRGSELYLPVTDLFDFLKIRNVPSPGFETITGFFIDQSAVYSINRTENRIIYQGRTFDLDPGDI